MTAVTVFPDAAAAGVALAAEIADGIAAARANGRRYLLGCPGGRSPRATYRALAAEVTRRRLDLSHLVIVMMDDYLDDRLHRVAPDLHFSCERFARTEIVAPLNASANNASANNASANNASANNASANNASANNASVNDIWLPDPADPAAYDTRLRDAGGIDLFILASGASDGHVAFNPPGTPISAGTRIVELAESTRRDNLATFPDFGDIGEVPRFGVTVGIATIAGLSARAVLVANGPGKRLAVARLAAAPRYDPDWPATVVAACRDASVFADRAARPDNHERFTHDEASAH
jgi:glucosamine-6-phosphate deaminase